MGFFGKLIGRPETAAASAQADQIKAEGLENLQGEAQHTRTVELDLSSSGTPDPAPAAAANIWDLEPVPAAAPDPQAPGPVEGLPDIAAHVSAAPSRKRRAKTRLLGFDTSDGQVVDLFNGQAAAEAAPDTRFPVGWIVVARGPGYGESFTLKAGMSAIGRGEDQAVSLDFGDTAVSRSNHAAIVYDPETSQFFLGHGGKSNIVRLNGQPVISNEVLNTGDLIRLGETTLRFVALCGADFGWDGSGGEEEADNVEIA